MTRSFYGFLLLILCASLALAGGKVTDRATPVPLQKDPPLRATEMTPVDTRPLGPFHSETIGTYTGNFGYWDYPANGGHVDWFTYDASNGILHAIQMIALDSSNVNPTRRTSYSRSTDDGVTWTPYRLVPGARSGYPSLALLRGAIETGAPLIANHNGDPLAPWVYTRSLSDPDSLDFSNVGDPPDVFPPPLGGEPIWPKVTSGANGEISLMGGVSGENDVFPAYTTRTTNYGSLWRDPWYNFPMVGLNGGQYTMRNNGGNTMGLLGGGRGFVGGTDQNFLFQSTNDGDTWGAPTVLVDSPGVNVGGVILVPYYSMDLMYYNGEPLVALSMLDTSALYSSNRIMIWSPTLGWKTAVKPDSNEFAISWVGQAGFMPISYPTLGVSGSNLVMAFTGFRPGTQYQDTASGGRIWGEIYVTLSTDGGNTWRRPVNITETVTLDDRAPCMAKSNPAGYVYLVWNEDIHPGSAARAEGEGPVALVKQKFVKLDLNSIYLNNEITALTVTGPSPNRALRQGTTFTPKAIFRNNGLQTQTSIPVSFQVLDGGGSVVYSANSTIASLDPDSLVEVTFATGPGTLTQGRYTTRAIVSNGDPRPTNDTTLNDLLVIPVVTVTGTYFENFEDTAPETGGFGWYGILAQGSGQNDWVRGTPAKTHIANAYSGTKCFVTKISEPYSNNSESALHSPSFDMTATQGLVRLEFYHNFLLEALWDGGWVEYSVDGGFTWNVADHALGSGPTFNTAMSTGWYNANIDSQVVVGAPPPPMFGDSTDLYAGNVGFWIKSTTMLPIGGYADARLRFRMSADANLNFDGWAIDDITLKIGASGTVSVPLLASWNMISNPVQVAAGQDSVLDLFPTSQFPYGFAFVPGSGYQPRYQLQNGPGYWAKFATAGSQNVTGAALPSLSVPVKTGWNMIGAMTAPLDTLYVQASPPGNLASLYYGYDPGYNATGTLQPGKGYWVKVNQDGGFLYLPPVPGAVPAKAAASADPLAGLNTLTVKDASGFAQTLYFGSGEMDVARYEMPPLPPTGAFDARFETVEAGYLVQVHEAAAEVAEFPVRLQAVNFPVTVSWNVTSDAGYRLTDGANGSLFRSRPLAGKGSMVISNRSVNRLVVGMGGEAVPTEFALLQNYPNPFNPSTTVKFALPEASRVTIEVYNLLGQRVTTLVSDAMPAGFHSVKWDGTSGAGQQVGSGVYFVRFAATAADGRAHTDVRKAVLMK